MVDDGRSVEGEVLNGRFGREETAREKMKGRKIRRERRSILKREGGKKVIVWFFPRE